MELYETFVVVLVEQAATRRRSRRVSSAQLCIERILVEVTERRVRWR
jgi:hypothetical protein